MTRILRSPLALCALAVLVLPSLAAAQSGIEITPTAGYRLSGQVTATDRDGDVEDTDVEVDESDVFGVIVDIPLGQSGFALELLANRQESAFILDRGLLDPRQELGDVQISYYQVGMVYEWGAGQVRPFVAAAAGIARLDPKFEGLDADDRASASLAFGAKILFSRNLGLRLEGRGYWANLDSNFRDSRRRDRSVHEALYQGEGTAGLILKF